MCCEDHTKHHPSCACGCTCGSGDCGCGDDCTCGCHQGTFRRRYQTRAEQIADLEAYLDELKTEVQAVEEHLADLRR